jgi:hypothetical protein
MIFKRKLKILNRVLFRQKFLMIAAGFGTKRKRQQQLLKRETND